MSATLVIDASVALKWLVTEAGSAAANDLLDRAADGETLLVAPEHLLGEVGNGLRKRVAQRVACGAPPDCTDYSQVPSPLNAGVPVRLK